MRRDETWRQWLAARWGWSGVDQTACAACLAVGLVALGWWSLQQCRRPQPLRLERRSPLPPGYQVDAATAPWPEWSVLPGIGPTLAKRIVAYRTRRGPFRRPEDLLAVPGIGPGRLEAIRPYVRFSEKRPSRRPDRARGPNASAPRR